jgi:hypothetical protein
MRQQRAIHPITLVVAVVLVVAGCGDLPSPDGQASTAPRQQSDAAPATVSAPDSPATASETFIDGYGERMFPEETVDDWARWSSHVVRADVVGEEKLLDRVTDAGPYEMVARDVVVEVTDVVWSNPNAIADVAPGDSLRLYTYPGYIRFDDGAEQLAAADDGPRMEVGSNYVVVLVDDYRDGEPHLIRTRTVAVGDGGTVVVTMAEGLEASSMTLSELTRSLDGAGVENVAPRSGESVAERWVRYMDPG